MVSSSIYLAVSLRVCCAVSHGAVSVPTVTVHSRGTLQYMYSHPQIVYSKAMVNS